MRTQHNSNSAVGAAAGWQRLKSGMALGLLLGLCAPWTWAEEAGVTDKTIRIGATIPLEGDYKVYGLAMKQGMDAALAGQMVQKRAIEFVAINDFYEPSQGGGSRQGIDRSRHFCDGQQFWHANHPGDVAGAGREQGARIRFLHGRGFHRARRGAELPRQLRQRGRRWSTRRWRRV
jgi:hypothetical protein